MGWQERVYVESLRYVYLVVEASLSSRSTSSADSYGSTGSGVFYSEAAFEECRRAALCAYQVRTCILQVFLSAIVKLAPSLSKGILGDIASCRSASHRDLVWIERALAAADMIKK